MPEESITVKISSDKKRKIRVAAARQDTSMSDWLRDAIDEKISRDTENRSPANPVLAD